MLPEALDLKQAKPALSALMFYIWASEAVSKMKIPVTLKTNFSVYLGIMEDQCSAIILFTSG